MLKQAGQAPIVTPRQGGVTVGDTHERSARSDCFHALGVSHADAREHCDAAPHAAGANEALLGNRHTGLGAPNEVTPRLHPTHCAVRAGDDDERVVGVHVRGKEGAFLAPCDARDYASPRNQAALGGSATNVAEETHVSCVHFRA